mgnify:CR=1 FL=1
MDLGFDVVVTVTGIVLVFAILILLMLVIPRIRNFLCIINITCTNLIVFIIRIRPYKL